MSYEPSLDNLPDDVREMGSRGIKLLEMSIRNQWIDWGLEDTRKTVGRKITGWVDQVGTARENGEVFLEQSDARLLARIAEVFATIEGNALRKAELLDKARRLDEGTPTENQGFKVIIEAHNGGESDDSNDTP